MIVRSKDKTTHDAYTEHSGVTLSNSECFLCGSGFQDVAICWMGHTASFDPMPALVLHPECVTDLAVRMFRDVHEVNNPDYYKMFRTEEC